LLLVFYLIVHIKAIETLSDPARFDDTMTSLGSWQFRVLEIGLLATIIVHAVKGVRILIIDFANGSLYQKNCSGRCNISAFRFPAPQKG